MEEIQFAVESGLGITILPSKNKAFYPSSLAYIPLGGIDARLSIGAAWMPSADQSCHSLVSGSPGKNAGRASRMDLLPAVIYKTESSVSRTGTG